MKSIGTEQNYITPKGLEKLRDEYRELFHGERPQVVKVVNWAAGLGDRSENADYIYNKRRLREIDRRLRFLQLRIDAAQIIDPKQLQSEKVIFGATVTILDEDNNKKTYQIIGEDEIDIEKSKISWKSPLATGLLGKKLGDEITIKKPTGDSWAEIIKIEFI